MSAATSDERDVPCLQCGYSLRGLPIVHRCPECGYPTLDSRLRFDSRPRSMFFWLSALAVGWAGTAMLFSGPRCFVNPSMSRRQVAQAEVSAIADLVVVYLRDHRLSAPPPNFTLDSLTQSTIAYLRRYDLVDPWGNLYLIEVDARNPNLFRIVSLGADGNIGGRNDAADICHDVGSANAQPTRFTVKWRPTRATR